MSAIEECPPRHKARAICSLAANAAHLGDPRSELKLYVGAICAGSGGGWCDPPTIVGGNKMIAVWKARDGSHRAALSDLEKLFPRWHAPWAGGIRTSTTTI
jgi:hypothetical protein